MNEFKVGDLVIDNTSGQFFKIIKVNGEYLAMHHRFWVKSEWIGLANHEEIKTGRRL